MESTNPFMNFDESAYLAANPDLQTALKDGVIRSGWEHFIDYGFYEDRLGVDKAIYTAIKNMMSNETNITYPPEHLRKRVHGADSLRSFRNVGRVVTLNILAALESIDAQSTLSQSNNVLDFGCGCGRVIRYLQTLHPHCHYFGTDIDRESIDWCESNLSSIADFKCNAFLPKMDYPDNFFDFVYSISVFTHLPEEMQLQWLEELQRVTKPGALLILTTHGKSALPSVSDSDKQQLDEKGFFYLDGNGTDGLPDFYQNAYHLPSYIEKNWTKHFEIVSHIEQGIVGFQDLLICRTL